MVFLGDNKHMGNVFTFIAPVQFHSRSHRRVHLRSSGGGRRFRCRRHRHRHRRMSSRIHCLRVQYSFAGCHDSSTVFWVSSQLSSQTLTQIRTP